jgi:hypothetical protein
MNTNNLVKIVLKHIEKASKANKNNLILTPKASASDILGAHGSALAKELEEMGYKTELSKDGNLDDCLRISW